MILVVLFSLKTLDLLQNGVATHFWVTPLSSMRTVSLASSQSCRSVDLTLGVNGPKILYIFAGKWGTSTTGRTVARFRVTSVNPGRHTSIPWWTPGFSTRSSGPSRGRAWSGLAATTRTSTTQYPSAPPPALACGTKSLTPPPSPGGLTTTRWMIRRCTMHIIVTLRPWIKWGTWWWRESLMVVAMGPHMGEFIFQLFAKLGFTIDPDSRSPSTWIRASIGNNVRIASASISS